MTSPSLPIAQVLILGCGRSGTSIFGELFEHLSAYTYFSELPYSELKALDFSKNYATKVPRESPGYPPTPGLSFPLEDFMATFPKPVKIFWQVRHPLDTICSLRVGIARNWGHHPQPPDWRDWLDRPLLEQCAHHWTYINTIGYEPVAELTQICRYEQMLADPLSFAQDICQEIGLDPVRHAEELQAWASRVQNTNNSKFVEAKTSRAYSTTDHQVRVERWKENLTPEEVEQLSPMIRETAAHFGYIIP